jgi:mono/diheme cytochrome c family protein
MRAFSLCWCAAGVFAVGSAQEPASQEPSPTPARLALGDSVYHGRVGGALCFVCHGPTGKGVTGTGPDLTDNEWLNADGTVASIEKVIAEGVEKPKKHPAPMPPKGGGQLTDSQIKAVAAYVYSLSHPTKGP